MDSFYITTPIYYVNDKPHIGHAYTTILCDCFARFNRALGNRVRFLTGTDEHGEKVARTAQDLKKEVRQHVDDMSERFTTLWKELGISNDDFIRTTEERHQKVVSRIIEQLLASGDIYVGTYKGWYCVPCESFYVASQLVEGKCPDCQREVKELEEDNYFLALSKYQDWLISYLNDNESFVLPRGKREEVVSFLKEPLEDLCISRPKRRLSWGIPFPDNKEYVVYVWFDALINYVSALGWGSDEERFRTWWPATIHMIGKDILRQHAVYWPIMLKALGLPLPAHVIAHGWWTIQGSKVSKSVGNVVDPHDLIQAYGVDTFKYYMLAEASLGSDGAYSVDLLIDRYNTHLANNLGNLVHRAFSMLEKYCSGVVPQAVPEASPQALREEALSLTKRLIRAMHTEFQPRTALTEIWRLIDAANKYVEDTKPWTLAKDPAKRDELDIFLYTLLEVLRFIAVALDSFLPATAQKMRALLQVSTHDLSTLSVWGGMPGGITLEKGDPLFPRIDS